MVRNIIFVVIFMIITGCCYSGKVSKYGLPRKEIKKINGVSDYSKIDTTSIYKLEIDFAYNKLEKEYVYYEKSDNNTYPYSSFLKFYSNGKLGLFVIPKEEISKLNREHFNPERAKMGYYFVSGNLIKTRISTIGDSGLYISNKNGFIQNDSITIQDKNNYGGVYVKKIIDKNLLKIWKPDW